MKEIEAIEILWYRLSRLFWKDPEAEAIRLLLKRVLKKKSWDATSGEVQKIISKPTCKQSARS